MTIQKAIEVLEYARNYDGMDYGAPSIALDMAISALRQHELESNLKVLESTEPPTNADRINAMTIEEKAEFLSSIAYGRKTPWSLPFAEKFCKNCPTTTCTIEGYHHPMELHECDFVDGKCPHGGDIVWWLQQPAEEDKNGM